VLIISSVLQLTLRKRCRTSVQLVSSPLSSPLFLAPGAAGNGIPCHHADRNDGLRDGEWNCRDSQRSGAGGRLLTCALIAFVFLNCFTEDWISAPVGLFFTRSWSLGFLNYFSGFSLKLSLLFLTSLSFS